MQSFINGVLAGGTVAYLHRTAGENSLNLSRKTWGTVALEANHLFCLVNIMLNQVGVQNRYFSSGAKGAYLAAPVLILSGFLNRKISLSVAKAAQKLTYLYYVSSWISSVALLALGKRAFAFGMVTMLALDSMARNEKLSERGIKVFEAATKVASLIAFIGYGAWILAAETLTKWEKAAFVVTAGSLLIPKIWNFLFPPPPTPYAPSIDTNTSSGWHPGTGGFDPMPDRSGYSHYHRASSYGTRHSPGWHKGPGGYYQTPYMTGYPHYYPSQTAYTSGYSYPHYHIPTVQSVYTPGYSYPYYPSSPPPQNPPTSSSQGSHTSFAQKFSEKPPVV